MSMNLKEVSWKWTELRLSPQDVIDSLRNPVVAHSLAQLKSLVLRKPWIVQASDPTISAFVFRVLSRIWNKLVLAGAEAVIWGFAPSEVIWTVRDVPIPRGKTVKSAVIVEDIVLLSPPKCYFLCEEESGQIVGLRLKEGLGKEYDILEEKAFWVTHLGHTSLSPYGVPLIIMTKPYEEMFNDLLNYLAAWVENQVDPPVLGRAPLKTIDLADGKTIPAAQYLAERILELKRQGAAVIPAEFEQGGQSLWSIEAPLKFTEGGDISAALQLVVQLIRQAMFGVQATFTTGHVTTPVPGEDLIASFVFAEILEALNFTLLKHLVRLNWGEGEWAVIDAAETGQVDIDLVRDLVRASLQFSPSGREELVSAIDWTSLLDTLGVPVRAGPEEPSVLESLEQALEEARKKQATPFFPLAGLPTAPTTPPETAPLAQAMTEAEVQETLEKAGLKPPASASPGPEETAPPVSEAGST